MRKRSCQILLCFAAVLSAAGPSVPYAEALKGQEFSLSGSAGTDKPVGSYTPPLSKSLDLSGSRSETLNFLVKIDGTGCAPLRSAPFRSQNSTLDVPISLYIMQTIVTRHPSFNGAFVGAHYDPVTPINGAVCSGEKGSWIFGELKIPENAAPGAYTSSLFTDNGGLLPITLNIWKMKIPQTPAVPAYFPMTTYTLLLGHYGEYHAGEADLGIAYRKALLDHRIYSLGNYVAVPDFSTRNGEEVLDFENYPSRDQSLETVSLAGRPADSYFSIPLDGLKEDPIKLARYLKALQASIGSLNRPGKALFYAWDEPAREEFSKVARLTSTLKQFAPAVKRLVTTPYSDQFRDSVDIFVPVMDQFDDPGFPKPETYKEFKKSHPNSEVWWYVSCMSHGCDALANSGAPDMVIDRPAAYIKVIPWLTEKYGLDAFLYYEVAYGYQFYPKRDPWSDLWDFSGNGDGTLFYPARAGEKGFRSHGPIASLRLKEWREGSFDAEYIRWMNSLPSVPEWWRSEFNRLVKNPREWTRNYQELKALRDRAGSYLNEQIR